MDDINNRYNKAIFYVHQRLVFGEKIGLSQIKTLMKMLGNPEDKLSFVHIAGTNGKGSTSYMCASILSEAGYKVGLFVSPFVVDFRERIQINGEYISMEDFCDVLEIVKEKCEQMEKSPSEFEVITACAFLYFQMQNVDIVVLEVGLGGRFDATNIIEKPLVCAITKISKDHTKYLGNTLSKIAFEKCGIIKKGGCVVTYPSQHKNALNIIIETAKERECKLIIPNTKDISILHQDISGTKMKYLNIDYYIPFAGAFQAKNASVAIEIVKELLHNGYIISENNVISGIAKTKIPARMEILLIQPLILLDGAHNENGISALARTIKTNFSTSNIIFIMGMLSDKDYNSCISKIAKISTIFIATQIDNKRTLLASDVKKIAQKYCDNVIEIGDVKTAIDTAKKACLSENDVIVISGSLFLASEVKSTYFCKKK